MTATYIQSFTVYASWLLSGAHRVLDLSRVGEIARVSINGTSAGTLWALPYPRDVLSWLKPWKNDLTIEVTNEFTNRILGDKLLPEDKLVLGNAVRVRMIFGGPEKPPPSGLLRRVTLKSIQP